MVNPTPYLLISGLFFLVSQNKTFCFKNEQSETFCFKKLNAAYF